MLLQTKRHAFVSIDGISHSPCSIIVNQSASSFAALFSAFLYSVWYTRASFRSALLFSATCPFIGNLLYSVAITYNSMKLALFGRALCGFGSAEVINRQLISACVSVQGMTRASALFVTASAIGMGIGPLIAGEIVDSVILVGTIIVTWHQHYFCSYDQQSLT